MAIEAVSKLITGLPEMGSVAKSGGTEKADGDFGAAFTNALTDVNKDIVNAQKTSEEFLTEGKHDLHEVMIALEKADVSFRYLNQVRNKVLDAYNEVMRMQV